MIEIKKEELLKNTIDYEDYSENICNPSIDELIEAGIIHNNGCCSGCCGKCKCQSKKENYVCGKKCKN
ncbi:MAG: hypothetical protein ACI398_10665 [Clostridium sp.]